MRLVLSKIFIAAYLSFHAYTLHFNTFTNNSIQKVIQLNIDELELQPQNAQFLQLYLLNIIVCCFFISLFTIFSKNILPKVINVAGIALWIYFGIHPKLHTSMKFMQRSQHIAIAGALLYIAGLEFFEKSISLEEVMTPPSQEDEKVNEENSYENVQKLQKQQENKNEK